jgi:hypothetical protein
VRDIGYDPNYDSGGDGFSHLYVIMHKYFVKKPNMQICNLTCFLA